MPDEVVPFRMPADLIATCHRLADESGMTFSEWLRAAVLRAVASKQSLVDAGYRDGIRRGRREVFLRTKDAMREVWEELDALFAQESK